MVKKYIEKHPTEDIDYSNVAALVNEISTTEYGIPDEVLKANLNGFMERRALRWAIADNIEKIETNSDQVIDDCLEKFEKVRRILFSNTDLGFDYFDKSAQDKHWEYIKNPEAKVPTGWPTLD